MPAPLAVVVLGHAGTGKSTLLGHLMLQCGTVKADAFQQVAALAKEDGKAQLQYAWLMDASKHAREQGATIEAKGASVMTDEYAIALTDTPGRAHLRKNAITMIAQADVALLVVDATLADLDVAMGEHGATRELALLAFALGIRRVLVAVNKMDDVSVAYAQSRFTAIQQTLRKSLLDMGFADHAVLFVPTSAWQGDNLAATPSTKMPWYAGPTLLEALTRTPMIKRDNDKPLRIVVQHVYRNGALVVGRIESGTLYQGMTLRFGMTDITATASSIQVHHKMVEQADAGSSVGVMLSNLPRRIRVQRGDIASDGSPSSLDIASKSLCVTARIVVQSIPNSLRVGYTALLHCHAVYTPCTIEAISAKLDRSTSAVIDGKAENLVAGDVAIVALRPVRETAPEGAWGWPNAGLVAERLREYPSLARIVLRDANATIAVGFIEQVTKTRNIPPPRP